MSERAAYGPPGTAPRWCDVHDEPAAECWSSECLTSPTSTAQPTEETK